MPGVRNGGRAGDSATIAIYSVKGGVGKTTLSANLAFCSAQAGRKTLLWDLDAAGGAGFLYGVDAREAKPAETVFTRERDPQKLIRGTGYQRLDLLPADESIRALDEQLLSLGKRKRLAKLATTLGKQYERIILDCPPVLNEVSAQVMRAADLVIVPLPPSPLSARAFDLVVREVSENSKVHPPILPVLSMLDLRRKLHREAREANPDWPVIPYASIVEQSAVHQRPVGALAPSSPAAQRFAALWRAIERKLAGRK
ncbi:MAG: ParA family protein [Sphingomonadaceae bacterium]